MSEIICLANSRKGGNRCIAGIAPTGVWIRPVSALPDGAITEQMRKIDRREPSLLDVLDIPLDSSGPDYGFQPENRSLRTGKWSCRGRVKLSAVLRFCDKTEFLLHNSSEKIGRDIASKISARAMRSLQLIQVANANFYAEPGWDGLRKARVSFTYNGIHYQGLAVTDPEAEKRVFQGNCPGPNCLLTVSLTLPFNSGFLYKLVAGVVEL